jgi:glutamate racemase
MSTEHISRPIGVFDSGIGGISVLAELIEWMPNERFIYFGDTKNAPYGVRSKKEVRDLSFEACSYLVERNVKAIVVACNTATSASINELRKKFPIPIVGMEPALKVAVDAGHGGKILVMATPMTLKESKFMELVERYSGECEIEKLPAPQLVELVERAVLDGDEAEEILRSCLGDLSEKGVQSIVLGCTHFVFLDDTIKALYGDVQIVDGNKGTARHLVNLLMGRNMLNMEPIDEVEVDLCTSSEDAETVEIFKRLLKGRIEKLMNKKQKHETERELEKRIIEEIRLALRDNRKLTEIDKKLISYRYGIQRDKITEVSRIARELNMPKAKVEICMEKAEKKLFNIIKDQI